MSYLVFDSPQVRRKVDLSRSPCPAVMAAGMGSAFLSQFWIEPSRE